MSTRTEILLIALITAVLAAISSLGDWVASGREYSLWFAGVLFLGIVVFVAIGALAWAGWGRWLLSRSGAGHPSRSLWRLWFVPWAVWAFTSVREPITREMERHGFPDEAAGIALALPFMVIGAIVALATFVVVLTFAFRELGHLSRQRRAGRGAG